MAVLHSPESGIGKELWKWDHSMAEVNPIDGSRGMRPVGFQEYPKRLYKASRPAEGGAPVYQSEVAESADMERNLQSRGFCLGHDGALEALDASQRAIAKLAAERHFHERRMSEGARREVAAAEEETDAHLPEIPALPIKRRAGRPKKEATHG